MDDDFLAPFPGAPHSPPDRGARLAVSAAAEHKLLLPGHVGGEACELAQLLSRQLSAVAPSRPWAPSARATRAAAALALANEPSRGVAALLETFTLANLPQGKIGARLRMSAVQVETYEALFFNVRRRLDDRPFILEQAIAPELSCGPVANRRRRFAMKFIAYHCGGGPLDDIYACAPAASPQCWEGPPNLLKRLAAQLSLDCLADLYAADPAGATSPERAAALVAQMSSHLAAVCRARYPETAAEREVANMMEMLGGLNAMSDAPIAAAEA